jgi:hypothetical protein
MANKPIVGKIVEGLPWTGLPIARPPLDMVSSNRGNDTYCAMKTCRLVTVWPESGRSRDQWRPSDRVASRPTDLSSSGWYTKGECLQTESVEISLERIILAEKRNGTG